MIRAEGNLHDVDCLETFLACLVHNQFLFRSTHCEDTRLRRVDNSGKRVYAKHSQV